MANKLPDAKDTPPEEDTIPERTSLSKAVVATWNSTSLFKKVSAVVIIVAINVGLPFINGVMLGFGEIFARTVVAPRFGLRTNSL